MVNMRMTEDEREAYLAEPHIGVMSVANDQDRPPHAVPLWYHYELGGTLTFFTATMGRKTGLIERVGLVSPTVQQETFPYKYVSVEGTVVHPDRPPSAERMLAIVSRYLPEEQAQGMVRGELDNPSGELVLFTIRPDHWRSADFSTTG